MGRLNSCTENKRGLELVLFSFLGCKFCPLTTHFGFMYRFWFFCLISGWNFRTNSTVVEDTSLRLSLLSTFLYILIKMVHYNLAAVSRNVWNCLQRTA